MVDIKFPKAELQKLEQRVADQVLSELSLDDIAQRVFVPVPKQGDPGKDATVSDGIVSAITVDVLKKIRALVKDGEDGKHGTRGQKGNQGEIGPRGHMGLTGEHGTPGKAGKKGKTGTSGIDGQDGINGVNGKKGTTGKQGRPGTPGQSFSMDESVLESFVTEQTLKKLLTKERAELRKNLRTGKFEVPVHHSGGGGLTGAALVANINRTLTHDTWRQKITPSATPPENPSINDIWVDIS